MHPVHVELASMNCAEAETTPNDPARREEKNGQTGDPLRGGYLPLLSSPDFHPSINRFLFTTTEKQSVLLRTEESEKGAIRVVQSSVSNKIASSKHCMDYELFSNRCRYWLGPRSSKLPAIDCFSMVLRAVGL